MRFILSIQSVKARIQHPKRNHPFAATHCRTPAAMWASRSEGGMKDAIAFLVGTTTRHAVQQSGGVDGGGLQMTASAAEKGATEARGTM